MDLSAPSTPLRVLLDTTRRCQLNCWYCHSSSGPDYRGPVLDGEAIPELFDAVERLRVLEVTITGGEPTLWSGLVSALGDSHRLEFTSLQLITNALTLTPAVLRAIEASNLSRICVSLDGVAEVHDANRGAGSRAKTLRGIRDLRTVNGNITVISVLDATNHDRWPELTGELIELGVSQHHLAPVCFAGHAMNEYRGLSAEQFNQIATRTEQMSAELPPGFILRFNDTLLRAPRSRTMALSQMTETWKGWHVVVRPDGDVRTAVRAWGRSWRANETHGNIGHDRLESVLGPRAQAIPAFSRAEEVARKFHLGATDPLILTDITQVAVAESAHVEVADGQFATVQGSVVAPDLGVDIAVLGAAVRAKPEAYRLRQEAGFVLLFDTRSHEISILAQGEVRELARDLVGVRR